MKINFTCFFLHFSRGYVKSVKFSTVSVAPVAFLLDGACSDSTPLSHLPVGLLHVVEEVAASSIFSNCRPQPIKWPGNQFSGSWPEFLNNEIEQKRKYF